MGNDWSRISRREFCRTGAVAISALAAGGLVSCARSKGAVIKPEFPPLTPSPVVVAVNPNMVIDGVDIDSAAVQAAFEAALPLVTETDTLNQAWESILPELAPKDNIGIKVNSLSPELASHPQVAMAVARSLMDFGIDPARIIIWDRANDELRRSGYELNTGNESVRVFGTEEVGYDLETPLFIRRQRVTMSGIATRQCRYLISLPVLKNHDRAGVTFALKNWYGSIPLYDGMPFSSNFVLFMHTDNCSRRIAQLNSLAPIRGKLRLVVGDAVFGAFSGGPGTPAQWTGNRLIVSRDPVAADAMALEIIDGLRKEKGLEPVAPMARFLASAQEEGLGYADLGDDMKRELIMSVR